MATPNLPSAMTLKMKVIKEQVVKLAQVSDEVHIKRVDKQIDSVPVDTIKREYTYTLNLQHK